MLTIALISESSWGIENALWCNEITVNDDKTQELATRVSPWNELWSLINEDVPGVLPEG